MSGLKTWNFCLSLFASTGLLVSQTEAQEKGAREEKPTHPALVLSRKPSAEFTDSLAPLLTPLKEVLALRGDYPNPDKDGIILLDESIVHTDASGKRTAVYHYVEEALTESGTQALEEQTFQFRTDDQKIHLVQARTIQADGSELSVEDRGVIMESPQTEAGDSVYGDRGQMRIIFSRVQPGVVREVTVVIEDQAPRMADQFSTIDVWGAYWPTRHARMIVHMPESVATRLKETRLGAGVPTPTQSTLPSGYHTWTYEKERVPAMLYEGGRAPRDQTGPAVFLTTLPDWEAFGTWYRQLLDDRSTLSPSLKALAKEWTKEANTSEEKIKAIFSHVARDVRYTGLEFGKGAHQPRDPEQVWTTSYGDCKDKSNLVALLLRSIGIEARLALIQTEHTGRIERRSPDTRHFNHAIVAVKTPSGWEFSDPTIRYGKPGMLAPSSSDREVLIIKEDNIEWTRTPSIQPSSVHYHIDASRDEDGSLEGWLELSETDYYAATDRAYYERLNATELKREIQPNLTAFFPGARLIDAELGKPETDVMWRLFFSLPSQSSGNDPREPLRFPIGSPVYLSVGNAQTRESSLFLWPVVWKVTGSITLPEGWAATDIPSAFDLHTDAYEVEGRWEFKGTTCMPHYEARVTRALVEPTMYEAIWRGTQSLQNWLQKPAWLTRNADVAAAPAPASGISLGKFPLMPSGEGQLAFVEERYPLSGNRHLRRAALRKTLEYFPNDPLTVFMARARLALTDWEDNKNEEAEKALSELLTKSAAKVDEETIYWARYMLGAVLQDSKKYPEAVQMLKPIVELDTLSGYRRGWASYQFSLSLEGLKEEAAALDVALAGLKFHDVESSGWMLRQSAKLLFQLKREDELNGLLKTVIQTFDNEATPVLTQLARQALGWTSDGHVEWAQATLQALEGCGFETQDETFLQLLQNGKNALAGQTIALALQKELQEYLKANSEHTALIPPADGWPQTAEECAQRYEEAAKVIDADLGHRLALHYITAYPPDAQFSRYLWHSAAYLEHHERIKEISEPSPLLLLLIKLGQGLPKSDDNYFELKFLHCRTLENRGENWQAAAAIFAEILADKEMPKDFRPSAIEREANCYEKLKDWKKVASTLSQLGELTNYASSGDGLARAAQIYLEMGEPQNALKVLAKVESNREFLLKNSAMADTLTEWLALAKDEKGALERWKTTPSWWPQWEELRQKLDIEETEVEPLIQDIADTGAVLQQAIQDQDTTKVGQIYRQVVHSSRWLPARSIELAWMSVFRLGDTYPTHRQDLLKFAAVAMDAMVPVTEEQGRIRSMYLSMCYIDTGAPDAALKQLKDYFETHPQDEHAITFVMSRLWATLAKEQPEQQPTAIKHLENDLRSSQLKNERVLTITTLAGLLHSQNRGAEIIPLLERELKHPAIIINETERQKLTNLLHSYAAEEQFSQAIKRWLAKHAPSWYNEIAPKSLKDLDPGELQASLEAAAEEQTTAEAMKLYYLAASESSLSSDERARWWATGLNMHLHTQALTQKEVLAAVDAILEDPSAPDLLKDATLRIACLACADMDAVTEYQHWRHKLADTQISPFTRGYLETLDALFGLDLKSPSHIGPLLEKQARKDDPQQLRLLAYLIVTRAILHGNFEATQAVSDALAKLRKGIGTEASALQTLRLEIAQQTRGAKKLQPIHQAMAAVVAKHWAHPTTTDAEAPEALWGLPDYSRLGSARYRQWITQAVANGVYERSSLKVWYFLATACAEYSPALTWDMRRELIAAAIQAATDDQTQQQIVSLCTSYVDSDNPTERDYLNTQFKPWRDATKQPGSYGEIRAWEAHTAMRNGLSQDIQGIIPQVKPPSVQQRLRELHLQRMLTQGSAREINEALDALGTDAMLEASNLYYVIPALQKSEREVELELAVEAAKTALRYAVHSSWCGNDTSSARVAVRLAGVLQQPELLPDNWSRFVSQFYPEPHDKLVHTMSVALLKQDWETARQSGLELTQKYPTYYSNYWGPGKALWELGKKAEAKEYLKTFTQYCHDELEHPIAVKMLQELDAAE